MDGMAAKIETPSKASKIQIHENLGLKATFR